MASVGTMSAMYSNDIDNYGRMSSESRLSSSAMDFSPSRRGSGHLKSASSALSVLLSIHSSPRIISRCTFPDMSSAKNDNAASNPFSSGSFYGSYNSDLGLPEGYNEVALEKCPQPKLVYDTESHLQSKTLNDDTVQCGELIRALVEYFKALESGRVVASSMPFNGSTRELNLDDLDLLPAEDDGSVIDDLPLFSEETDLLSLGINDFILYDHERDIRVAHIHLDPAKPSNPSPTLQHHDANIEKAPSLDAAEDEEVHAVGDEEDWDNIQVFRTDTEEDLALLIEKEKSSRPVIAKSLSKESVKEVSKRLAATENAVPNRMRSSSGNLTVSCRRPGSQRWRVAHRVHSMLVDATTSDAPSEEKSAASQRNDAVQAASAPRRHSDRPVSRFSHDPEDPLDAYVRKWSETSTPSRQSSLGPSYALNMHTSSLTPCFSPSATHRDSATNRESEAQIIMNAYGSRFSMSQDSFRSSSRTSDHLTDAEADGVEVEQRTASLSDASDPFIDIPYSKSKGSNSRIESLHILSIDDHDAETRDGGVAVDEIDGSRPRTRGLYSPAHADQSLGSRTAGLPPRTPHSTPRSMQTKKIPSEDITIATASASRGSVAAGSQNQQSSFFRRFVSSLFGQQSQSSTAESHMRQSEDKSSVALGAGVVNKEQLSRKSLSNVDGAESSPALQNPTAPVSNENNTD